MEFQELEYLDYNLIKGLNEYGLKYLSKLQESTLYDMYNNIDLLIQSPSGTGKTTSFSIGALSKIDLNNRNVQCIILTNTHILANQIVSILKELSKYLEISIDKCIGGQISNTFVNWDMFYDNQIIVATPGKLLSLLKKKKLNHLNMLILDEADILFSIDFQETIFKIFENINNISQICMFSATFTQTSLDLINTYLENPKTVYLKNEEVVVDSIYQYKILLEFLTLKDITLRDIYENIRIEQCIIFVNSIHTANNLYQKLTDDDHTVGVIHKNIENKHEIMKNFRLGEIKILISTDILARGIDIESVNVIINYELPYDISQYIHRIGRTGRYHRQGIAINFVLYQEEEKISQIEKKYSIKIDNMPNFDNINKMLFSF